MIKHFIQKARIKFFEPGEVDGNTIYLTANRLGSDPVELPPPARQLTAEQQRIELLELQNQQLRADIAKCKSSSIGFAHEMRRLLTD